MIKHIVMWKLKEVTVNSSKAENAAMMKRLLEACSDIVPGILKFEVAIAQPGLESTYDVVLYSEFMSRSALEAYNAHPQHQSLKALFSGVREARQCIDYEI